MPSNGFIDTNLVSNELTGQGTSNDVEANFSIKQVIQKGINAYQLRSLVASDAYCQKVVGYLPRSMGDVKFNATITASKRARNTNTVTNWINDNLKTLMPWFVEAQTQANIVGKAYLMFAVETIAPREIPYNVLPLLENLDLKDETNKLQVGKQIFYKFRVGACDEYVYSRNGEFLIRRYSSDGSRIFNRFDFDQSKALAYGNQLILKYGQNRKRLEIIQHDIVHVSHVIEFTAFEYQDDREVLLISKKRQRASNNFKLDDLSNNGISFRLTRFLPALLRYLSFINATLNRLHRSEATVYKKENLGETNQAIARHVSQSSGNNLVPNITELLQQELESLRRSLRNFGIAMVDKSSEVEMISRSMAGIDNLDKIFSKDLISASGLTEFSLFGMTSVGAGLANVDVRDRAAIAKQTDELFADYWKPHILYLANLLGIGSGQLLPDIHTVAIHQEDSFKLSELEASEWLEKRVKVLLDLLGAGVIDQTAVRNEISSNGSIGRYFALNQADLERLNSREN